MLDTENNEVRYSNAGHDPPLLFSTNNGVASLGAGGLVLGFLERPVASSIAILTVAVGIPAYFIFKKKYKKE